MISKQLSRQRTSGIIISSWTCKSHWILKYVYHVCALEFKLWLRRVWLWPNGSKISWCCSLEKSNDDDVKCDYMEKKNTKKHIKTCACFFKCWKKNSCMCFCKTVERFVVNGWAYCTFSTLTLGTHFVLFLIETQMAYTLLSLNASQHEWPTLCTVPECTDHWLAAG